ncbi:MAG: formyltransferase family protein, partial [candidate division Zixibacteria bacterium]|nr:formyltransferase family protein [candidate division Zixibacteria bacterium]
ALAGYLSLIPPEMVKAYRNRIVNIHNALLPKYGGKGMYGHHTHQAVLAANEKESGPTVHLVDEIYDNGRILGQKQVPVHPDDTPDSLSERVLEQEHKLYARVLQKLIKGEYDLD